MGSEVFIYLVLLAESTQLCIQLFLKSASVWGKHCLRGKITSTEINLAHRYKLPLKELCCVALPSSQHQAYSWGFKQFQICFQLSIYSTCFPPSLQSGSLNESSINVK